MHRGRLLRQRNIKKSPSGSTLHARDSNRVDFAARRSTLV
jgi:hypothetical protein